MDPANDKLVDYQLCKEGCNSLGTGPNLVSLTADLMKERSRLVMPKVSEGNLGDAKTLAAESCSFIKTV